MRTKKMMIFTVITLLFAVLPLAGCLTQPAEPAEPPQPTEEQSYPAPAEQPALTNPYLEPERTIELVPYNPYPAPVEGEQVDWSQMSDLLNSGEVAEVLQLVSLQVQITTKDGRVLLVQEPTPNEIFVLIGSCGAACADIVLKSEF